MSETKSDDLFDAGVGQGLRELDGLESPPDVTDRVLAGVPSRAGSAPRRTHAMAAILVVALGLATAITVWMDAEDGGSGAPARQDRTQGLPPPVTLRSGADAAEHPVTTQHVRCVDFRREDLRALARFLALRGVILDGREFERAAIKELSRFDKLEQVVVQSELSDLDAPHLRALGSLPRLRMLGLTFGEINDAVMNAIAVSPKLTGLALRGNVECSPESMQRLARKLPKLRRLSVEALRDPPGTSTPNEVWAELPATLVELRLHKQSIRSEDLRRLPGLKKLDLFGCYSVGRELLALAGTWPGCVITAPSGAHLAVDAKGRCVPQPRTVELIQRKDNGPYKSAGYGFRSLSRDLTIHGNYVDLVFDSCGQVHTNVYGGCKNRIVDLGKDAVIPALDRWPDQGWLDHSFRPQAGHTYLMKVRGDSDATMHVHFRVGKVEGDRLAFTWQHCDAEQAFLFGEPERRGHAGTKGQCGSVHGDR